MATQSESRICSVCGKKFIPRTSNQKYCSSECAKGKTSSELCECLNCHKEFFPPRRRPWQKYCSAQCRLAARKAKREVEWAISNKTLDDWAREANECNLDYGTYRALIMRGDTFEKLKETAISRPPIGHASKHYFI